MLVKTGLIWKRWHFDKASVRKDR